MILMLNDDDTLYILATQVLMMMMMNDNDINDKYSLQIDSIFNYIDDIDVNDDDD